MGSRVWVPAPEIGFLWTPGYWDFDGGYYLWHVGYWGPHVGFYGGIDYGWGYGGRGFYGGRWEGGAFRYNTEVWHVNDRIHNTYHEKPAEGPGGGRAAFHGRGGVSAEPTAEERTAMNEHHAEPTSVQRSHEQAMSKDRNQFASVNKGKPATTAMSAVNGDRFNNSGHAVSKAEEKPATSTHTAAHASGSAQHTATHQSQPEQHTSSHTATQQPAQHQQHTISHSATQQPAQHQSQPQQHTQQPAQHQSHATEHTNTGQNERPAQSSRPPQQHMAPPQQHMQAPPQQHQGGGGREGGGHRLTYMPMRVLINE